MTAGALRPTPKRNSVFTGTYPVQFMGRQVQFEFTAFEDRSDPRGYIYEVTPTALGGAQRIRSKPLRPDDLLIKGKPERERVMNVAQMLLAKGISAGTR